MEPYPCKFTPLNAQSRIQAAGSKFESAAVFNAYCQWPKLTQNALIPPKKNISQLMGTFQTKILPVYQIGRERFDVTENNIYTFKFDRKT